MFVFHGKTESTNYDETSFLCSIHALEGYRLLYCHMDFFMALVAVRKPAIVLLRECVVRLSRKQEQFLSWIFVHWLWECYKPFWLGCERFHLCTDASSQVCLDQGQIINVRHLLATSLNFFRRHKQHHRAPSLHLLKHDFNTKSAHCTHNYFNKCLHIFWFQKRLFFRQCFICIDNLQVLSAIAKLY